MIGRSLESAEFTSASPGYINHLIQINELDSPDFEAEIKQIIQENSDTTKTSGGTSDTNSSDEMTKLVKSNEKTTKKLKRWEKSNIGDINRMTSSQFGNVRQIAENPVGFMMQTMFRKFAKGAGVVALALLIFEAVKWIISELLKPGRMLDIRFKRDINKEILAFRQREEQQKIKQGFSSIIITTMPRLRGGQGQFTNTLDMAGGRIEVPDNFGMSNTVAPASGQSHSKSKGRGRFGQ